MSQEQSSRNFPRPMLDDLQRAAQQLLIQFHYYGLLKTTAATAELIKNLEQEVSDEYDNIT